jgi:hypothetical protein
MCYICGGLIGKVSETVSFTAFAGPTGGPGASIFGIVAVKRGSRLFDYDVFDTYRRQS